MINEAFGDRVRRLRTAKSWSLEHLSEMSGVSRSMLSQIERNQANPTLNVALKIAGALGVSLASLVESSNPPETIEVIPADSESHSFRDDDRCRIRTLSPLHLEKDIEIYEVTLGPGAELASAAHFRGTREFLTVTRGSARVRSGSATVSLKTGDSAGFRADVPHVIANAGEDEAKVFLVVSYQATQ